LSQAAATWNGDSFGACSVALVLFLIYRLPVKPIPYPGIAHLLSLFTAMEPGSKVDDFTIQLDDELPEADVLIEFDDEGNHECQLSCKLKDTIEWDGLNE
jgi:hypothetical protein